MENEYILVKQTPKLQGSVKVSGAKNSVLKLMAAAILIPGETRISNVPDIADVRLMQQVLESLGIKVGWPASDVVSIDATELNSHRAPYELVAHMRASTAVLGPLAARLGRASVALPGGCAIGSRKIDMHISGLEALGAHCHIEHGYIEVEVPEAGLKATEVTLDFPSVGATENLVLAAVGAQGKTTISNAAREPEISDLVDFLIAAGVSIEGRGTTKLVVEGILSANLKTGFEHKVVGDRIEAGTFLVAGALVGGPVTVTGFDPEHLTIVLKKLRETGADIAILDDGVCIERTGPIKAISIQTLPFPGFPTDMQAQFMTLMSVAQGSSIITENVFENRFMFADEIARMGADIRIEGHHALVNGVQELSGAPTVSPDLRGGAALVLAGLVAEGETRVSSLHHIDRGYEQFSEKLQSLGARIERFSS
ncbi:MAG: UDP-N-acetylglucosamine 1-carboxyvinyltransferase [Coriobacteriia bacterium]|nr:UDP-N-acetylglucosamine 1-carboxyvinyltransferase [Coriobacteriia bacterium]MCL2747000.1 UDP-N-acetylglucosamine 1-carboxyvinyltransferase [Coriobacteriia bacterium]MCL2870297.1 UDP-N-acetylglucosamine 1-carboxyvinyltransferase [Coriobacteriia bacterium]